MTAVAPTARHWLTAAAADGLRDTAVAPPTRPLADADWNQLLGLVRLQRVEGPLAFAVASERWPATAEQADQIREAHRQAMTLAILLERDLLAVARQFAARSIDVRVLKGPAIAHLDEHDPSRRSFGDIDLLVRGDTMAAACEELVRRGGTRRFAEPRSGFDRRFTKGASFTFAHNSEIDLHRTLATGPFGLTIDTAELFEHAEPFSLAGDTLLALDRPSRFIHACVHAVLGGTDVRVTVLRDIVCTVPGSDADGRVMMARAHRWHLDAVIAAGVTEAVRTFGWQAPEPLRTWARRFAPSSRERRWLATYHGARRSHAAQSLAGIEAVPRLPAKVAYATAIAFPTSATGRAALTDRWRRGARALRHTFRP